MYRQRIRDHYDHLSRSYRKVADFILSNYYEVSFMTAAQLAFTVVVDTTTVVRFSQRLGFDGYPELLHDIRDQVKAEIYAAYEPQPLAPTEPGAIFLQRAEEERHNLSRMIVHNPPEHMARAAAMLNDARSIVLVADGYAEAVAELAARQMRHRGLNAHAASDDPAQLAGTLTILDEHALVIGVSGSEIGREVGRALQFARSRGAATLGVVGSLSSTVNRMSDLVIYAPASDPGPLPGVVTLAAALSGLVMAASPGVVEHAEQINEEIAQAYAFLIQPDAEVPEDSGD